MVDGSGVFWDLIGRIPLVVFGGRISVLHDDRFWCFGLPRSAFWYGRLFLCLLPLQSVIFDPLPGDIWSVSITISIAACSHSRPCYPSVMVGAVGVAPAGFHCWVARYSPNGCVEPAADRFDGFRAVRPMGLRMWWCGGGR